MQHLRRRLVHRRVIRGKQPVSREEVSRCKENRLLCCLVLRCDGVGDGKFYYVLKSGDAGDVLEGRRHGRKMS